ncbi:TolC family protein [Sulfurospirillum sp. 1612]|uniref:TolC family protein n=1 Tax=Sulfurospirillum sp. 1612 TaxID=3094835 RepID=UPI002F954228
MRSFMILCTALMISTALAEEPSLQTGLALQSSSMSFSDLVGRVEATSPKILQQKVNTELSKAKLAQVTSQYYPTINLGGTSEYSHKFKVSATPSYIGDSSLTQDTQYQTSSVLSVNYDLFRFGATYLGVKAAKKEIVSSLANQCVVSEQVLLELLDTYQKARVDTIKLKYLSQIEKLYEKIYSSGKRLRTYGSLKQTDLSTYALNVADTIESISQFKEDRVGLIAHLAYLSGAKIDDTVTLDPLQTKTIYTALPPFEKSTKARQARAVIEQKTAELEAEEKSYFPVFSLYGKYDFYGSSQDTFSNSIDNLEKNGYRVGLAVSWKIFDGFKREADIKIKLLELKNAKISQEEAKRKYEEQERQLNYQIHNISKRVLVAQTSTDTSHEIVTMSTRLHAQGEGDQLQILKSKVAYYQNLSKNEVAKEMLASAKMKKVLILRKESECTAH